MMIRSCARRGMVWGGCLGWAWSRVSSDHLTWQVEGPVYPLDIAPEKRNRESAIDTRKLSIPIHHLEGICIFGVSTVSAPALSLCWEHGVAVNFLSEHG